MPLLSILIPSRRPEHLTGLLDSIEQTVSDPNAVEVLVKIDDDMPSARSTLEMEKENRPFKIDYLNSPRHGGVFTLWSSLDDLFNMTDPGSYFVMAMTDETKFLTPEWDEILRKYVGFFEDDAFRLRISACKLVNYSSSFSCCTKPESFPIFTRRWLELTEGLCNLCYGSDCYQQSVAFHLGLGRKNYQDIWQHDAHYRDIQIHDIEFGGFEFGQNISEIEGLTRSLYMYREWKRINSFQEQRTISFLAKKIALYCWAIENGVRKFYFSRRETDDTVAVIDQESGKELKRVAYRPARHVVYFHSAILNLVFCRHQCSLFVIQIVMWVKAGAQAIKKRFFPAHSKAQAGETSTVEKGIYFIRNLFSLAIMPGFAFACLCIVIASAFLERLLCVFALDGRLSQVTTNSCLFPQPNDESGLLGVSRFACYRTVRKLGRIHRSIDRIKRISSELSGRFIRGMFVGSASKIQNLARSPLMTVSSGLFSFLNPDFLEEPRELMGKGAIRFASFLIRLPFALARLILRITLTGSIPRYCWQRLIYVLFLPFDMMTRISIPGLETPQPYNPLSFWFRFRSTGYPIANVAVMKKERDRVDAQRREWGSHVFSATTRNKPISREEHSTGGKKTIVVPFEPGN